MTSSNTAKAFLTSMDLKTVDNKLTKRRRASAVKEGIQLSENLERLGRGRSMMLLCSPVSGFAVWRKYKSFIPVLCQNLKRFGVSPKL